MKPNILVAPAHYLFSDTIKSEVAWSYALVKYISSKVNSIDVLAGVADMAHPLPRNVNLYPLFKFRSTLLLVEFLRHLFFYPLITIKAVKLMTKKKYQIIHHMLPLSYATFNPLVLITKLVNPQARVIMGPLQLPQIQKEEQDLNVVYLGKQEYSLMSKIIYKATMLLSEAVKPLAAKMFESADLVVCNSQTSLLHYSRLFPNAKFHVIYTGIDKIDQPTNRPKIDSGKIKILCAGVFSKRKGQVYLLKAMVKLVKTHPHISLTLIGGGDQDSVYRDFVAQNNLSKYVKFTGQIPYSELLQAYQNHHIFCLPTLSDTSPYVILEAMSYGLPIVATDIGSIKEMVDKAGLIAPPGDFKALEISLSKMISQPELRFAMSKVGMERVNRYYTWDKITDQWVNAYHKLLT